MGVVIDGPCPKRIKMPPAHIISSLKKPLKLKILFSWPKRSLQDLTSQDKISHHMPRSCIKMQDNLARSCLHES